MPARFINVSNSGRASFRNVNNSGRAIFGEGGPTTTTTTTILVRLITIYARLTNAIDTFTIQYSYDNASWTTLGTSSDTSCGSKGSISVNNGSAVAVRVVGPDLLTTYFYTRAFDTTSCPTYDTGNRSCNGLISNVTSDRNVAITINGSDPCS